MCSFDFYIVPRNLGRGYWFGNLFLQWGCSAPHSSPVPDSTSFLRSPLPAGWPLGMAGHCSVFPRWGCTKVDRKGCLGRRSFENIWLLPTEKCALSPGPLQKGSWGGGQQGGMPRSWLQPCLGAPWSWAEQRLEGYLLLFPAATEKEDRVFTACQAGSAASTL